MVYESFFDPKGWLDHQGGPRYLQLKHHLERAISEHSLTPGTMLPPEREIARLTGLSRVTVRKAVAPLIDKGLIEQRRGSGTQVTAPVKRVEQSLSRLTSYSEDMVRRGIAPGSSWLSCSISQPSPEEIMNLGLGTAETVVRLERLRTADGTPMAIERASLPTAILPDPEIVSGSLYEALERLGTKPVRAIQRIIAANLAADEAALLGVAAGVAGLKITRISYMENGKAAEFTRSIYRGDAYDFIAELKLINSD